MPSFRFQWIREDTPGPEWAGLFEATWPSYRRWFQSEGDERRPDRATSARQLARYMPELVPVWEGLCDLTGDNPQAARMLCLYDPAPYVTGCSQAIWHRGEPFLVRNYDFHPDACEGVFLHSSWNGTRTLVASDCLWGALDGMNEHGLVVSLSFGGSHEVGPGFGIPLILRYVLETCSTVAQAVRVLERVPSHMSYNVSILQASGEYTLVAVAPDRSTSTRLRDVATNHQDRTRGSSYARFTQSVERERFLEERLGESALSAEEFIQAFLAPPLLATEYERSFGTIYTAVYRPETLGASFLWPTERVDQGLEGFVAGERTVELGSGG